ncbi:laccase [Mortierella alpina]|nr:laccase [Mortierella alpina]
MPRTRVHFYIAEVLMGTMSMAFVVCPLYDLDDESSIVTLSDWYHSKPEALMTTYGSSTTQDMVPTPDGGLINGQGPSKGSDISRSVIRFAPYKRIRLRVANLGSAAAFQFSIDGHRLKVIEVDGTSVSPYIVDRLRIDVGQRYSIVLETKARVGNYWIRAVMDTTCFSDPNAVDPEILGILRYTGAPIAEPVSSPPAQYEDLIERNLRPLGQKPAPLNVDERVTLSVDVDKDSLRWAINGKSWGPTDGKTSILREYRNNGYLPDVTIHANKVVELTIKNNNRCSQPFHLHGFKFHVVSEDGVQYNFDNPIIRDTVTVPGNGVRVLRFVNDNPGVWAVHSQNEWYRHSGAVAPILASPLRLDQLPPPPQAWDNLCQLY